ncbi:MAG TPA: hypothetical protein VF313_11600 [Anaerolineaceae bacterium]
MTAKTCSSYPLKAHDHALEGAMGVAGSRVEEVDTGGQGRFHLPDQFPLSLCSP